MKPLTLILFIVSIGIFAGAFMDAIDNDNWFAAIAYAGGLLLPVAAFRYINQK